MKKMMQIDLEEFVKSVSDGLKQEVKSLAREVFAEKFQEINRAIESAIYRSRKKTVDSIFEEVSESREYEDLLIEADKKFESLLEGYFEMIAEEKGFSEIVIKKAGEQIDIETATDFVSLMIEAMEEKTYSLLINEIDDQIMETIFEYTGH